MPILILIVVILILVAIGILLFQALPFILILALAGWLYYKLTKPKQKIKTQTFVIYTDNPFMQNPPGSDPAALRAPRAGSIDAEYTEEEMEPAEREEHD